MKFTATKENLLMGISTVQKAISTKNTMPILSGIYMQAKGNVLIFAATDMELGIVSSVPAQILEEGSVVIPAHYFIEIARKLPNTNILFEYLPETVTMRVVYNQAETTIQCWKGEEFPEIPNPEEKDCFHVHPAVFRTMVKQTSFCANLNEQRQVFTGSLMEVNGNDMNLICTDSHRLSFKTCKVDNLSGHDFKMVVPVKALNEIIRIMKEDDTEEPMHIRSNGKQICFEYQNIRLVSGLIDSPYPNYKQVIPSTHQMLVKAKKQTLLESIDRASLFTPDRTSSVLKFHITENNMFIHSKSEYGTVNENVNVYTELTKDAEQDEINLEISFNSRYLMDAMKNFEFEDMEIEMSGPLSAAVIRPLNDNSFLYLLLPLRSQ